MQQLPLLVPKHFYYPQMRALYSLSTHFLFSPPSSLAVTNLLFFPVDLTILGISYKWNPMIHDLLCLASSLNIMFSGFVPVVAGVSASSLSLAEYYSSVWIDHVFVCPFVC